MNKKSFLGLISLVAIFVTGCGNNSESIVSSESTKVSESTSVEDKSEYYVTPDGWTNSSFKVNYSNDAIDIGADKELITGLDYLVTFGFYEIPSESSALVSSNENVLTIEKIDDLNYKIHCIHDGNAFISLTDSNELLRYRHLVMVRDAMSVKEMADYLVDVDHFEGVVGGEFTFTFLFDGEVIISGTLVGSEVSQVGYRATYEYVGESADGRDYMYKFTDETSASGLYKFEGFNISKTGDFLYFLSYYGVEAILLPPEKLGKVGY